MNGQNTRRIELQQLSIVASLVCSVSVSFAKESTRAEERTLSFAVSHSIGTLELVDQMNGQPSPIGPAFGIVKVKVPQDRCIKLSLNKEPFAHPADIDAAPATGIEILETNFMAMDDRFAGVCDAVVAKAGHFKNLKMLVLSNSDATDAGVQRITTMPNLERIYAALTELTGKCFKNFGKQFPNLKHVLIWNCDLDNASLQYLAACTKLSKLDLRRDNLNAEGFRNICKCKGLTELNVSDNAKIGNASLKDLLSLKHLNELRLNGTSVTLAGLKQLEPLHLTELWVSRVVLDAKDMPELKKIAKNVYSPPRPHVNNDQKQMFAPLSRH